MQLQLPGMRLQLPGLRLQLPGLQLQLPGLQQPGLQKLSMQHPGIPGLRPEMIPGIQQPDLQLQQRMIQGAMRPQTIGPGGQRMGKGQNMGPGVRGW